MSCASICIVALRLITYPCLCEGCRRGMIKLGLTRTHAFNAGVGKRSIIGDFWQPGAVPFPKVMVLAGPLDHRP